MYEKERLARLCELRGLSNLVAEVFPEEGIEGHRQFQKRLAEDHLSQLAWILNYLGGRSHELFAWLLCRYRIENLKVIFRGFHARRGPKEVGRYLVAAADDLAFPVENMVTAPDADEFARLVPEEALKALARQAVQPYKKKAEPFFFEAALDGLFYSKLLALADEASPEDLASCLPMLALDANIYLVMLALRARFNYGAGLDEIEQFLNVRRALPVEKLRGIYSAASVSAVVEILPKNLAKNISRKVETAQDLERELATYFYTQVNAAFYGSWITLAVPVAFYYLKRTELANLIRLSEGYRYGLSPSEMRRVVVPPLE